MVLVPHHSSLSPTADAYAAAAVAAAAAATASSDRSRCSRCRAFQHEALQVRGHHNDEFQKKSPDQPLSIKIQNQTADHHRDHQRSGLPFRLQRGVQVRAGHREQAQVQVHEHDGARTKAQAAVAPVHQHGQHRGRLQAPRQAEAVLAAGRHQHGHRGEKRNDETGPVHGDIVRAPYDRRQLLQ